MATFVESTVKDIDERLAQLKQEVSKLEAARSALVGRGRPRGSGTTRGAATDSATTPRRTRRRRSTTRRRPGRPRGSRGGNTRANQALELVRTSPGMKIPEIAKAMGIEPNYLYRVLPRLAQEGRVRREGQGWHAVGS